jgi:methylisocitrate lyase
MGESAGLGFRRAVEAERPLQVVGVINAYCARLAQQAGFRALYLSGAGVANASLGLPDLGLAMLADVLEDARRIAGASDLPLLVDCDTGWGSPLLIARTVREMTRLGVAAIHLEDQVDTKRCGHRPGKRLVRPEVMVDRLKAAVDARIDPQFVIMARTDACSVEGLDQAVQRAGRYVEAGADMIFVEAPCELADYRPFVEALGVPVLANLTEFGCTPLFALDELRQAGVRLVLYPLSAFRAMAAAAAQVYESLRRDGSQRELLSRMQSREDLYRVLDYHTYERKLDAMFDQENRQS